MGLDIETVLVPVDGSGAAEEALAYAVALAERYDAGVHVLYVVDEELARRLETGDVDPERVASTHIEFMKRVDDTDVPVGHSTAAGFSPSRLSRHPGSVILDVAESLPADFVVVPRETPSGDAGETIGKSALYVLQYASQPVLSV